MKLITKHLLIFCIFFLIANCLHLHDASQNYIQYLIDQQYNLQQQLNNLQTKLKSNFDSINQQSNLDLKISKLQTFLRQQRLLLSEISLQLTNRQMNSSQSICPQISTDKKNVINKNLDQINQNLKAIDSVLQPLNEDEVGKGIDSQQQEIKAMTSITDSIKTGLYANVQTKSNVTTVNVQKMTNLNSASWILDSISIETLNADYNKVAESNSLEFCSIQAPYLSNTGQCISCPNDKQYFNLKTKQCISCFNFDPKLHQCKDSQASKTNYNASGIKDRIIIPNGQTIESRSQNQQDRVTCPPIAPFFDGSKCINCQKFFNIQTKKCTTCEEDNVYNVTTHVCQMKKMGITNLQAGKGALIISENKTFNNLKSEYSELSKKYEIVECPSSEPFYNDLECITCNEGTYFNLALKSCGTCSSGQLFNNLTNHCEKVSYYSDLDNPSWSTIKNSSEIINQTAAFSGNPLFKKCSIDKPFSTGKQCISCPGGQHFDFDKKTCTTCANGQVFNVNLHKCTNKQSNYQTNPQTALNLIYEGRAKNEWIYIYNKNQQQNPSLLDCPVQSPFFDGNNCLMCPQQSPYFNLQYRLCQKCEQNTKYDAKLHDCLTIQGNIATQEPTLQKMAAGIFA